MAESDPQFTWACPQCGRNVPQRVDRCRCGHAKGPTPQNQLSVLPERGQAEMFCTECGATLPPGAAICMKCGVPASVVALPAPAHDIGQDPAIRLLLPVGRSGYAIAAGYLGLFSLLVVPAPLALIFAILAIRHIKRDPTKHGMGRAVFGLIMGILGSGFLLFLLAAMARG